MVRVNLEVDLSLYLFPRVKVIEDIPATEKTAQNSVREGAKTPIVAFRATGLTSAFNETQAFYSRTIGDKLPISQIRLL